MDEDSIGFVGLVGVTGALSAILLSLAIYTRDTIFLIATPTTIAVISLVISLSKFWFDSKENKRRKTNELIDKLQPRIYDTAAIWAVRTLQSLRDEPDYELKKIIESPPDFSKNLYYIGIVGKRLKSHFEGASNAYSQWNLVADLVIQEYHERLLQEIKKSGLTTELWRATVVVDGAHIRADIIAGNYSVWQMRNYISKAKEAKLKFDLPQGGTNEIPCPKEVFDAIQYPENLPSFAELRTKRKNLLEAVEVLIKYLEEIVKHGEKDWRK